MFRDWEIPLVCSAYSCSSRVVSGVSFLFIFFFFFRYLIVRVVYDPLVAVVRVCESLCRANRRGELKVNEVSALNCPLGAPPKRPGSSLSKDCYSIESLLSSPTLTHFHCSLVLLIYKYLSNI